jgi:hypothetical protein
LTTTNLDTTDCKVNVYSDTELLGVYDKIIYTGGVIDYTKYISTPETLDFDTNEDDFSFVYSTSVILRINTSKILKASTHFFGDVLKIDYNEHQIHWISNYNKNDTNTFVVLIAHKEVYSIEKLKNTVKEKMHMFYSDIDINKDIDILTIKNWGIHFLNVSGVKNDFYTKLYNKQGPLVYFVGADTCYGYMIPIINDNVKNIIGRYF